MNKRQSDYYADLKRIAVSEGWEVVSQEYINSKHNMVFKCPQGHVMEKPPGTFKKYRLCLTCGKPKAKPKEEAKAEFLTLLEKDGYTLKSNYVGTSTKVIITCPIGHEYDIQPSQ